MTDQNKSDLQLLSDAEKMLSGAYREIELFGEWDHGFSELIDRLRARLAEEATPACTHRKERHVGITAEGMGNIIVHWCPDCGALKRTMTNWKCTDYPWEIPNNRTI